METQIREFSCVRRKITTSDADSVELQSCGFTNVCDMLSTRKARFGGEYHPSCEHTENVSTARTEMAAHVKEPCLPDDKRSQSVSSWT